MTRCTFQSYLNEYRPSQVLQIAFNTHAFNVVKYLIFQLIWGLQSTMGSFATYKRKSFWLSSLPHILYLIFHNFDGIGSELAVQI